MYSYVLKAYNVQSCITGLYYRPVGQAYMLLLSWVQLNLSFVIILPVVAQVFVVIRTIYQKRCVGKQAYNKLVGLLMYSTSFISFDKLSLK